MKENKQKIVFFDGECLMCNRFISWLSKKNHSLKFASLAGNTSQRLIAKEYRTNPSSIIFWQDKKFYLKKKALVKILKELNFVWKVVSFFYGLIPNLIANKVYDWVARNRYRFNKNKKECPLIDRSRLLD